MAPPSDHPAFHLRLLSQPFEVAQLKPDEPIPLEYIQNLTNTTSAAGKFISLTRTDEEISIVRECGDPSASWRCIKIAGPMDFGITGVMCDFTTPLKAASVPVFAVSTWNTDYVLVPKEFAAKAVDALKADGWQFTT